MILSFKLHYKDTTKHDSKLFLIPNIRLEKNFIREGVLNNLYSDVFNGGFPSGIRIKGSYL
jgi:hypothetical protein